MDNYLAASSSLHSLFDLIALLASNCNLFPYVISKCNYVEVSPAFIFMIANFIVLAIFITSSKPSKPAAIICRQPFQTSLLSSSCKQFIDINHGTANDGKYCKIKLRIAAAAAAAVEHTICYGALQLSQNPKETLNTQPITQSADTQPSPNKEDIEQRSPPDSSAPLNPNQAAISPLNHRQTLIFHVQNKAPGTAPAEHNRETLVGFSKKAALMAPPADECCEDLNKKFDDFINSFFARMRAEIEESR